MGGGLVRVYGEEQALGGILLGNLARGGIASESRNRVMMTL